MNTARDRDIRAVALIAQTALINQLDEQEALIAKLRSAEELTREIVKTLQDREAQVIELIEENQTLRRRLVETEGRNGEK